MAKNGGEQHEPEDELDDDEEQLALGARLEDSSGRGERERAQVEALQVLADPVVGVGRLAHPEAVLADERRIETVVTHDDAIEASVPVKDD